MSRSERLASIAPVAEGLLAEACAAWPGVGVEGRELAAYIAAHAFDSTDACVRDLFLACGCAKGDTIALRHFERALLGPLVSVLERRGIPRDVGAEAVQLLRTTLLIRHGDNAPRIVEYAGRGPLDRCLRVSAVRLASKVRRHERVHARLRTDPPVGPLAPDELAIRARYGLAVDEAFHEALGQLGAEDRLILRLHFGERLNLDRVASLLRFSRATAGRRVLAVRGRLRDAVVRLLSSRIDASVTEAESLIVGLWRHVDVSLDALVNAA